MDKQHKVDGDEDAMLVEIPILFKAPQADVLLNMDKQQEVDCGDAIAAVPISFAAPRSNVLLNMDKQQEVDCGDAIAAVPISFAVPQSVILLNMDEQHKVDGDDEATLMEVPLQESKADVSENMDKQHTVGCGNAIAAVPISSISPQANVFLNMDMQHKVDGDGDATLMEVPIIFVADIFENKKGKSKVLQMIPENMHYLHTHTFEQRRQNWIIKNKSRPSGSIIDYEYHHLETDKKFRSLTEVYKFIVYGDIPIKNKKSRENGETLQVAQRRKPHVRGDKLIKHYVVGTCEYVNGVYIKNRKGVDYLTERDIPFNFEKKSKRENEDLYGYQQVSLEHDSVSAHVSPGNAALNTSMKLFHYLWDFELLQEECNAKVSR